MRHLLARLAILLSCVLICSMVTLTSAIHSAHAQSSRAPQPRPSTPSVPQIVDVNEEYCRGIEKPADVFYQPSDNKKGFSKVSGGYVRLKDDSPHYSPAGDQFYQIQFPVRGFIRASSLTVCPKACRYIQLSSIEVVKELDDPGTSSILLQQNTRVNVFLESNGKPESEYRNNRGEDIHWVKVDVALSKFQFPDGTTIGWVNNKPAGIKGSTLGYCFRSSKLISK